jgi:hypothetical protein
MITQQISGNNAANATKAVSLRRPSPIARAAWSGSAPRKSDRHAPTISGNESLMPT